MSSVVREKKSAPPLAHQMALFDAGIDMARLKRAREVFMAAGKSQNTRYAYKLAWKWFTRWCRDTGRTALPATTETLELYLADLLGQSLRIQTIRVKLSGIADHHIAAGYPSPFREGARTMLSNAARTRQQRPQQKSAITPDHVRAVMAICSQNPRPKVARDAALFLLGFALGWRRSELASLTLADIEFVKGQGILVSLGASKTDQEGKGRCVSIPFGSNPETCPVKRLEAWIAIRGRRPGALFCVLTNRGLPSRARTAIGGRAMWVIVKDLMQAIGANPRLYSPHSWRAGCVTAAYLNGANEKSIMARTGHRSVMTVLDYVRPLEGFQADPLAGVL